MSESDPNSVMHSFTGHIAELRRRLLWAFAAMAIGTVVCWYARQDIYAFLLAPLIEAGSQRMIYTSLPEAFMTYLKISFFAGVFLTFPILLAQIWLFVAPALYKKEKRAFLPYLVATPFLFFLGGAAVYYGLMPLAWSFFLGFQTSPEQTGIAIENLPRMQEYLDLSMTLIFVFGLCFQLPVLLTLLGHAGIISSDSLRTKRRYAIVIAFAVAAPITPPDIFSQVLLAIPMYLLYEISIFLIRLIEKGRGV